MQKKCRKSACMKSKHKIATFKKSKKRAKKKSKKKQSKKQKRAFFWRQIGHASFLHFFCTFFCIFFALFLHLFRTFFSFFRGKCKVLAFPEPQQKWGKSGRTNSRATKKVGEKWVKHCFFVCFFWFVFFSFFVCFFFPFLFAFFFALLFAFFLLCFCTSYPDSCSFCFLVLLFFCFFSALFLFQ